MALAVGGAAGYELSVTPESVAAGPGEAGAVSLTIAPAPGHSIDRRGPLRVTVSVEPGEGLVLPRRMYERRHAADERADAPRFDLRYRADAAGQYRLLIDARFWVCRRHSCWPARERREIPITVAAPAPPPGIDAGID